jgi:hypothetical protein
LTELEVPLLLRGLLSTLGDTGPWATLGIFTESLWTRWLRYLEEGGDEAFRPRRVSDEDTLMQAWALADREADWPGYVVVHHWRLSRYDLAHPRLQPGPYSMAATLEGARALIPPGASLIEGLPLHERYVESWVG